MIRSLKQIASQTISCNASSYNSHVSSTPPSVVQVLPAMESGGVESGTLEISKAIVQRGWESIVISSGGRLVPQLEAEGTHHIEWALGRKSIFTLFEVPKFRRFIDQKKPNIIHAQSRLPAWVSFLAWRKRKNSHTRFVTTVNGAHSVSRYSEIMTSGERVICVSKTIQDYVTNNYPRADVNRLRVIPHGIESAQYKPQFSPQPSWLSQWQTEFPQIQGRKIVTLAGRITRLKGQIDAAKMFARLLDRGVEASLLFVGDAQVGKERYAQELHQVVDQLGIAEHTFYLGHRSDLKEILSVSDVSLNFTLQPEAFGRTVIESLALGTPVVAYDHGGAAEQLKIMLPSGRIPVGDLERATQTVVDFLRTPPTIATEHPFTLDQMQRSTLTVYEELLSQTFAKELPGSP